MKIPFRVNNFDLIRLFAALQVALQHASHHLEVTSAWWSALSAVLPGVPIFFFISGFLISRSYESNSRLAEYSWNRAVRIYPALLVCTALSLLSVAAVGYFRTVEFSTVHFLAWVAGQITIFQFYNPDFMRGFGTGVLNGSLWTISVELQFYLLIPMLYAVMRWFERRGLGSNAFLAGATLLFVLVNLAFQAIESEHSGALAFKLLKASFAPWFYMFLIGVIAQRNFGALHGALAPRFPMLAIAYLVGGIALVESLGIGAGNRMHPLLYLALSAVLLSAAYWRPETAGRLVRHNDVSYGIYIYHIPIINLMMFYGLLGRPWHVALATLATVVLAALSWRFVERPALARKKRPLNPLASPDAAS